MDKRKKLSDAHLNAVKGLIKDGCAVEAIAMTFKISTTHVYRIKSAMHRGEVKLKRSSLASCLGHIKDGLPFRRVAWPENIYYYCAIDEPVPWFIHGNMETGSEVITYTLDLRLEDIQANDWVVMTWDSIK